MSSAGHVMDMNNRLKQNRALKLERKSRYQKVKDAHLKVSSKGKYSLLDKTTLTEEELYNLKLSLRKDIIKQQKRGTIFTIVFSGIVVIAVVTTIFLVLN